MIIYKAENLISGRLYIGKTVVNLNNRIWDHFNCTKKGSKSAFHCAIRKYGQENFEFSILEECSPECDLNERERFYISKYGSLSPNGYNLTPGGDGLPKGFPSPNKDKPMKQAQKEKLRIAQTGKKDSEETRKKKAESQTGHHRLLGRPSPKKGMPSGKPAWNKGLLGFLKGRPAWNRGLTGIKTNDKGKPAWNKGLTKETDPRVAQYAENLKNSTSDKVFKKGKPAWNKGISIPQTEESNLKRSETMTGVPKSEEARINMILAQRARRQIETQHANIL